MLYVYTNRENKGFELYVGETVSGDTWQRVTRIQADGHELHRILKMGYPDHKTRVQSFLGDTARQIILNWG